MPVCAVQFPPYSIISSGDGYDLRLYQPHIVVQIPYATRDEGYDALGGCRGTSHDTGNTLHNRRVL